MTEPAETVQTTLLTDEPPRIDEPENTSDDSSKEDISKRLKPFFELFKDLGTFAVGCSVVVGSLILWVYCYQFGLLSTLSNADDTGLLVTYAVSGYTLIFGGIFLINTFTPLSIVNFNDDLLRMSHINWAEAEDEKNKKNWRKVTWAWCEILFLQFVIGGLYLSWQIYGIEVNISGWVYFILWMAVNLLATGTVLKQYADFIAVIKELSKTGQWIYRLLISFLLVFMLFAVFVMLFLIQGLNIQYMAWLKEHEYWGLLLIILGVLIGGLLYSVIAGVLVVQTTERQYRQRYLAVLFISFTFTAVAHYFNPQGILNNTMQVLGIQTSAKERDLFVYRFKKDDVKNELVTFLANEYAEREDYIYVRGYSIFNFRKNLVLCPISVPVQQLKKYRFRCVDMSGVEYKRFNAVNYQLMVE